MVGSGVMAILIISIYAVLTSGFSVTRFNRENLRATQIMINRLEGLRLYNWSQLAHSNMVPATFTEVYYPLGTNGMSGTLYSGTVTISNVTQNPPSTYGSNMREVTVRLSWTTGSVPHSREMITYVSEYGVQNYLFAN